MSGGKKERKGSGRGWALVAVGVGALGTVGELLARLEAIAHLLVVVIPIAMVVGLCVPWRAPGAVLTP